MLGRGHVRALAATGAVASVAATGGGLALQTLAGGDREVTPAPAALALTIGVFGALIVWHRPSNRVGRLLAATGGAFALAVLAAGVLDWGASPGGLPRPLSEAAYLAIWVTAACASAWALFILWFPDGSFPSAGWRRFFVVGSIACVTLATLGYLFSPVGTVYDFFAGTRVPRGIAGPFASEAFRPVDRFGDLVLLFPLLAIGGLVHRFRRATPVVRQQITWLLASAALDVVLQLVGLPLQASAGSTHDVGVALGVVGQPLPVVGATVAILRYRLWEFDVVVSRALVYGVLWALLSALLLAPALAAGLLVGGRGALEAVGLALLVTLVFQPARRRLERLAERLVYRRARPHVLLTDFWETLRSNVELGRLGPLVAGAVREGLAVEWAGVWLYAEGGEAGTLRPLGVDGAQPGPVTLLSPAAAGQLRSSPGLVLAGPPAADLAPVWPATPSAIVPLVGGDELVGVLACGPRRGDALGPADFELLELLARECALRLRNLRLEGQLRERLAQIETQAEKLRWSRQRLVAAQDEERRRIERDLHDGVQQQLVSLAVRLQRAAVDGAPMLGDLALEAEQAVFALQELARGIFPSVLADQGLAAALRTQAARMPLTVQIEVDPELAGRRLDREIEAALYFVALEALTNTQKHAAGSAASVWLRAERDRVVLEIADDGPGFDERGSSGTGLHNMEDRIAAVGGSFGLARAPGSGTRVVATAPAAAGAAGAARQPREADSRR